MICLASGIDESGKTIKMVQQIAAIYQLQSYKRFAFASLPVLELLKFEFKKAHDDRDAFMERALQQTIEALSRK